MNGERAVTRAVILLAVMLALALAMLALAVIEDSAHDIIAWAAVLVTSAFALEALAAAVRAGHR